MADLQKAQQIYDSMSAEQRKQFEQQYGGEQKAQDFLQSQQDRTPTQPQSTTRTQSTPTPKQEIQPQKAPTATTQQGRPELLPESDYKDDSDQRQKGIVANLNEAVYLNPQSLSDYNTFANYYNYEGRSDLQKQTLDNRYLGYQKSQEYSTKSVKELQSLYNANVISQSDLSLLKVYDPNKYNELNSLISKTADLKTYADQLSGTEITTPTNPFQGIIDNFVQGLQSFSQTNFYDEYRDTINSPALKQKNQEIIAEQAEMERLDLLINNKRKDVEERYAGTGATKSKIAAIIADETYELQLEKANRAITLNAMVNSYNSELGNAREELNLKLEEYNMNMQQRQMQMKELGFAMELMDFETNAQRDEREWNKFIREQEYKDGNIYSQDPATRRKAISNAVDNVLAEFAGIPIPRSREQMIEDIWNLVEYQGMSLGQAITKNIRDPIMNEPEYKRIMNEKFGVKYEQKVVNIGGKDYIQTTDANGEISFKPFVDPGLSEKINDYTYNKIDLGDGRVIGIGQTVNLAGQDYRITQLGGSMTGGVDLAFPKAGTKGQIGAFEGGTVLRQGVDKSTGNKYIEILNDNGYVYRYNHLEEIGDGYQSFAIGKRINQGDIIGRMGSTGKSTGVHLDLGVYSGDRANSMSVSPLDIVEQTRILFGAGGQPAAGKTNDTGVSLSDMDYSVFNNTTFKPQNIKDNTEKAKYEQYLAEKSRILSDPEASAEDILKISIGGGNISDTSLQKLDKFNSVLAGLGEILESIEDAKTGPILGILSSNNPYDTKSQLLKSQLIAIIPNLARGVYGEVGVLTDNDVKLYQQTIPNLRQTKDVQQAVLAMTLKTVQRGMENSLKTQARAGKDVSGFIGELKNIQSQVATIERSLGIGQSTQPQIDPNQYFGNLINNQGTGSILEQYNINLSNYKERG